MGGSAFLLVFVGILVLWMTLTGRTDCFLQFVHCLGGGAPATGTA